MATKLKKFSFSKTFKAILIIITVICTALASFKLYVNASYLENITNRNFFSAVGAMIDNKTPGDKSSAFYTSEIFANKILDTVMDISLYCEYYKSEEYFQSGKALEKKVGEINKSCDEELLRRKNLMINTYIEKYSDEEYKYTDEEYKYTGGYAEVLYMAAQTLLPAERMKTLDAELTKIEDESRANRERQIAEAGPYMQQTYQNLRTCLFDGLNSLYWIAVDNKTGEVFTNLESVPQNDFLSEIVKKEPIWYDSTHTESTILKKGSMFNYNDTYEIDYNDSVLGYAAAHYPSGDYDFYFGLDKNFSLAEQDIISGKKTFYECAKLYSDSVNQIRGECASIALLFVVWAAAIVALLRLCGKTAENEDSGKIKFTPADKLWNDIHIMLSAVISVCLLIFGIQCYNGEQVDIYTFLFAFLLTASYLFFLEWLLSFARQIKAKTLLSRSLWYILTVKPAKRIYKMVHYTLLTKYKKQRIPRHIINCFIFCLCVNIFFTFLAGAFMLEVFPLSLLIILLLLAFNALCLLLAGRFIKAFNMIFDIIESNKNGKLDNTINIDDLPYSLRELARDALDIQKGMKTALEKEIQGEKLKTELITNVSHDLKTPLTSIINYADLLKRCGISNETANSYIDILSEKSQRLKVLIDDLVEASMISTGNIKINPVTIDLCEFVLQAVGENEDMLNHNGLTVKLNVPDEHPSVIADGQKSYRIISNLLSNVKKYALSGSRVYIDITQDGEYGVFSIKNISSFELNISEQELYERFVRGDASRSAEGNGLGLSIAKSLCEAQNGKLSIEIDGDLFKAAVSLPLCKNKAEIKEQILAQ